MITKIVNSIPEQKTPNTMYLVPQGSTFDIHITDENSVIRKLEVGSTNVEGSKITFLTKEEYDQLGSKDEGMLYVIKPL